MTFVQKADRSRYWWLELTLGVILPAIFVGWPVAWMGVLLLPGAIKPNNNSWQPSLMLCALALAGITGLPALAALGTAIVHGPERLARKPRLRRWVIGLLIAGLASACLGALVFRAPFIWAVLAIPALLAMRYLVLILKK